MRRLIPFLIALCLGVGLLGYGSAAMMASGDDVIITPIWEVGDGNSIAGNTLSLEYVCGNHLRWDLDYTFGAPGETDAQFRFVQSPEAIVDGMYDRFEVWGSGGFGGGVSSGNLDMAANGWGNLLKTVAAATPNGGERSMNLKLADFVDSYALGIDLRYETDEITARLDMDLYNMATGSYEWSSELWEYNAFFEGFRFPVQEDTIVSVTIHKDEMGGVVGIDFYPENPPELYYITAMNAQGLYFVPIFRDNAGNPLPGDYPDGYGLYHIPWKDTGDTERTQYDSLTIVERRVLRPDAKNAVNLYPLDETLDIRLMEISDDISTAWMVTREADGYWLSKLDIPNQRVVSRIRILDYVEGMDCNWVIDGGKMLVYTGQALALVDITGDGELLMTAPVERTNDFYPPYYLTAGEDILHWDGEQLVMLGSLFEGDGSFFVLVCRQGEQVFCGQYDCSLLRGNDSWYYRQIETVDVLRGFE